MGAKTKELNKLAEDWTKAELDGDVSSLKEILPNDFVAVGPRGFVLRACYEPALRMPAAC
jgi:hypothetical protein